MHECTPHYFNDHKACSRCGQSRATATRYCPGGPPKIGNSAQPAERLVPVATIPELIARLEGSIDQLVLEIRRGKSQTDYDLLEKLAARVRLEAVPVCGMLQRYYAAELSDK